MRKGLPLFSSQLATPELGEAPFYYTPIHFSLPQPRSPKHKQDDHCVPRASGVEKGGIPDLI